jgi:hypothetical protein
MAFADNLKQLPSIDTIDWIDLIDGTGNVIATIENKPGKSGSLAVYNHLLQRHGRIDAAAAREGIDLFADHTEDATRNPGKHPNIDRLLEVLARNLSYAGKVTKKPA